MGQLLTLYSSHDYVELHLNIGLGPSLLTSIERERYVLFELVVAQVLLYVTILVPICLACDC